MDPGLPWPPARPATPTPTLTPAPGAGATAAAAKVTARQPFLFIEQLRGSGSGRRAQGDEAEPAAAVLQPAEEGWC